MKRKRLLLLCSCNFTKIGIETLVRDSKLSAYVDIITNTEKVEYSEIILSCFPDIVVMSLDNVNKNILSHFEMLQDILSNNYKSSKVIVIGNRELIHLFNNRFDNLLIINGATKINILKQYFINLITSDIDEKEEVKLDYTALTSRQLIVLQKLLSGDTLHKIAKDLEISYKTVSSHKCAALEKLGIRSLSPLILPMSEGALRKEKSTVRLNES